MAAATSSKKADAGTIRLLYRKAARRQGKVPEFNLIESLDPDRESTVASCLRRDDGTVRVLWLLKCRGVAAGQPAEMDMSESDYDELDEVER